MKKKTPPTHTKSNLFYNVFEPLFRFIFDVVKNFINDDCYAKASALAFYSLLSLVPTLAVIFGIAQGFGIGKALETEISTQFLGQREVTDKLIEFAHSWLKSVQGGVIAGVGTVVLLWSVISLLVSIESSLNEIWKIKKGRSFAHKIRDYLTIFFIAPIFFVTSSSINIYLITQITQTAKSNIFLEAVSPFLLFVLNLFPFFLVWVLFTFIYVFIPNTKVNFREAIISGIIAGTAFQLWQGLYIQFQINVSNYGAIYGSFAALPLFMIWLQVSWLIVLAGAEIAVELENGLYLRNKSLKALPINTCALLIVYYCAEAFSNEKPPLTDLQLARKLGISLNHAHTILEALSKDHILIETSYANDTFGYQPARPLQDITIQMIYDAIDKSHEIQASVQDTKDLQKFEDIIIEMKKTETNSLKNKSIYSLIT